MYKISSFYGFRGIGKASSNILISSLDSFLPVFSSMARFPGILFGIGYKYTALQPDI